MAQNEPRALSPNLGLVGQADGRENLMTPALVLDLPALKRNIATMADWCRGQGLALRPHAKTHKSVEIARLQMAAGAVGLCAAKLGEAEVLAKGGIPSVLITSPIVTPGAIARLMALVNQHPGVMVVADDPDNARALSAAASAKGLTLTVLVDLDVGLHRTGIAPGAPAVGLAEEITNLPGLKFGGLQAYAGQVQHVADPANRRDATLAALAQMAETRDLLNQRGLPPKILTGGGTGTHDLDVGAGVLNELQGGSYVFMDKEYLDVGPAGGGVWRFEPALFVRTSVISRNHARFVTTDAGLKAFATDGPKPHPVRGAPDGASYTWFGDEQGALILPDGAEKPVLGQGVECIVPHCDPTVNLYDAYHVVEGDRLSAIWPVDARGRGA